MLDHSTLDTIVRDQQAEAGRYASLQRLRRASRPGLRTRVARSLVGAASRLDPHDTARSQALARRSGPTTDRGVRPGDERELARSGA